MKIDRFIILVGMIYISMIYIVCMAFEHKQICLEPSECKTITTLVSYTKDSNEFWIRQSPRGGTSIEDSLTVLNKNNKTRTIYAKSKTGLFKIVLKKSYYESFKNDISLIDIDENESYALIYNYSNQMAEFFAKLNNQRTQFVNDSLAEIERQKQKLPENLSAHFESKGLKPVKNGDDIYWILRLDGKMTAQDVASMLEIQIDSILPLVINGIRAHYNRVYTNNSEFFRSSAWEEENKIKRFFLPPYPTFVKATGYSMYDLIIQEDRDLKINPLPPYMEDVEYASNLETYSGEFTYEWDINIGYNSPGTATYTYIPKPDGSRIFEGHFDYNRDPQKKGQGPYYGRISGQFKDNRQVGHWEWYLINPAEPDMVIDYDENGKIHGEVKNKFFHAFFYHGTLKHVKWTGSYFKSSGRFNNKGLPIGTWNLDFYGKRHNVTVKFDSNGHQLSSGYRDQSTGDWQFVSEFILIEEIPDIIANFIKYHRMRSTPRYNPFSN